jgi:hypothetical protein
MSRLTIAAQLVGSSFYPALPVDAGSLDIAFTAVDDQPDRETPLVDGKTVVLAMNTDSVAHTITITSVADVINRTGDIEAYSIAAGKVAKLGPFKSAGWAHTGAKLFIDVSDPTVRLAVLQLP